MRCPKCSNPVSLGTNNPASEQGALAVGGSPSTERQRYEQPTSAPAYQVRGASDTLSDKSTGEDVVQLLVELLAKGQASANEDYNSKQFWKKRKALVCASGKHRELIARSLSEDSCEVFVAEDTRQAVETMRANQLDLILLDPEFDPTEQGAAFVVREVNVLRPAQRRRLFFILLSPSLRTMDAHSAFLNNVNAVVNLTDLPDLTRIIEVGLREFNELYREFNVAFNLSAV